MHQALIILSATRIQYGVDPLYGDACSAKSFEVLPLIFITDCCPIDWLQSVLKIRSFEIFLIIGVILKLQF
jgi:hypothetical protein